MNVYRVAACFLFAIPAVASAQPTTITHVNVFTAGEENYSAFRIPAIETMPNGSLLAVCEARKHNRSDPGHDDNDIDLVIKRSQDGGNTWSKLTILDNPGEKWSACNPATVVDRDNDRMWLLHCRTRPGRSSATSRPGTDDAQAWARYTDDHGETWSTPTDITHIARDVGNWGSSFFGPGGAIQNRDGRLLIPLSRTTGRRNTEGIMVAGTWNPFVIYSDDHGSTWQRGELLPDRDRGDENQLVELADGRILMDVRQDDGLHRWLTTSNDGGRTWNTPRAGQQVTPVCCSIERCTLAVNGNDRNRILWTGPKGPGRRNLVVRLSYDEGKSFVVEKLISEEKAAYSDITILKDKSIGVLWERDGHRHLTFSRFNLGFLEPKE